MNKIRKLSMILFIGGMLIFPVVASAQKAPTSADIRNLESRLRQLEDYTADLKKELVDFSKEVESELKQFEKDVAAGLEDYSRSLNTNLDQRMRGLNDQVVVLNLASKGYRRIATNSGIFLISIQEVSRIQGGYRLVFHVGNPNYASFQGLKLNLAWGEEREQGSTLSYSEWRKTLVSAAFTYGGKLDSGTWTEVHIDVIPVTTRQLGHIEVSMEVESIQLNLPSPSLGLTK